MHGSHSWRKLAYLLMMADVSIVTALAADKFSKSFTLPANIKKYIISSMIIPSKKMM